jgi:two-component system sensor histidine kinase HydH
MGRTGRRVLRAEWVFYAFLVLVYLALAALLLRVTRGEKERILLAAYSEAEHALFSAVTALRNGVPGEELVGERLLGLGSYGSGGQALERFGSAPERVEAGGEWHWHTEYAMDERRRTVTILQQMGRPPRPRQAGKAVEPPRGEQPAASGQEPAARGGQPPPGREPPASPAPAARRFPRFLFAEVQTAGLWRRERLLDFSLGLWLLLSSAVLAFVYVLYRRGSRDRRRLEEQEQLVHLGEAARTLSHEIKNPLAAIRLRADVLARFVRPEGEEDLRTIRKEVDRLRALTDRVGDFLKNPLGDPQPVQLGEFLREVLPLSGRRVRLELEEPLAVRFDRDRLRSVVDNLVTNALQSDPAGGEVLVRVLPGKATVTLSVLDRGAGIARELREQVFEPFFTTRLNGSGIGLSISRRFVQAAGGSIALEAREGGGTEARVMLPRYRP